MYEKLQQLLTKYLNKLGCFLFPVECFACNNPGAHLCRDCLSKAVLPTAWTNTQITSIASYHNPTVQKGLWLLKYGNRPGIAETFGTVLHESLLEELAEKRRFKNKHKIYIVPIPLSKERHKMRGYNHVGLIAQQLIFCDRTLYEYEENVLIKVRNTAPQMTLSKTERLTNLSGAFEVPDPSKIRGRTILLIDDITTTGATMREAKSALQNAGARDIYCATIAH